MKKYTNKILDTKNFKINIVSKQIKSSSSSSYIFHGVRPLVDPFRSHVYISLFKVLP
jgi:hypothetical protein